MKARFGSLVLIACALLLTLTQPGQARAAAAAGTAGAATAKVAVPLLGPLRQEPQPGDGTVSPQVLTPRARLPLLWKDVLDCSTGQTYGTFPHNGGGDSIPAAQHPDKNLAVRGWEPTGGSLGFVNPGLGILAHDSTALQLPYLFSPIYLPPSNTPNVFTRNFQVYSWPWPGKGPLITDPPVTLTGIPTTRGTMIRLPVRLGGDFPIADYAGTKYYGLVLYAAATRITIVYIPYDRIVIPPGQPSAGAGYGLHIENICVDPTLLAYYNQLDAAGRGNLPALRYNQPIGRASGTDILVAVRDSGQFMDPRSYVDWWQP